MFKNTGIFYMVSYIGDYSNITAAPMQRMIQQNLDILYICRPFK